MAAMSKPTRPDLAEQLREAIRASGLTMYRLSQESGVHRSQLSRFMVGQRDLSLAMADKLCRVLGLSFTACEPAAGDGPPPARKPARKPLGKRKEK
jgi:plasmid maintenance system antidote protein VapI